LCIMFKDSLLVPSSRVKWSMKNDCLDCLTLEDGTIKLS